MRSLRFVFAAALVALLLSSQKAHACWDGYHARVGRVVLLQSGDDQWRVQRARELAQWLPRVSALLPEGWALTVEHGLIAFDRPAGDPEIVQGHWPGAARGDLRNLFAEVASMVHATPAGRRKALAISQRPFTVQIFASRHRAPADDFARAVNDLILSGAPEEVPAGFYSAGGYPAIHPVARVVSELDATGAPIARVITGAFLTRHDAEQAQKQTSAKIGGAAFVREL